MDPFVPDCPNEDDGRDLFAPRGESELVELLWENGNLFLQNQALQKPVPVAGSAKKKQNYRPALKSEDNSRKATCLTSLDNAPWLCAWDDSFGTDFSEFFCDLVPADACFTDKTSDLMTAPVQSNRPAVMPPPMQLGMFPREVEYNFLSNVKGGGSSLIDKSQTDGTWNDAYAATLQRSKDGSGGYIGSAREVGTEKMNGEKRKRRGEAADTDDQSEDTELDVIPERNKPFRQQSTYRLRKRVAEVHNLSERRRRDRINEKMKALQELIPRCNKNDKASILDEAIDYLKSLQIQVQVMSMSMGIAPTFFPGTAVPMTTGLNPAIIPLAQNLLQLTRMPYAINHPVAAVSRMPNASSPLVCATSFPFMQQLQNFQLAPWNGQIVPSHPSASALPQEPQVGLQGGAASSSVADCALLPTSGA